MVGRLAECAMRAGMGFCRMPVMGTATDIDAGKARRLVYVVEERINPSTDCFVEPALETLDCRVIRCGFHDIPDPGDLAGAAVVFVRYVPRSWLKLIEVARAKIRLLVFFMDDDLLDPSASEGLSLTYRLKLARLAGRRKDWLRRQDAALWVSTAYLQRKYADWNPRLLLPVPAADSIDLRRFFYHGTASHGREIRWLRPAVEEVLGSDERLSFEIIGGRNVYRLYRRLPRVTVVHPMSWSAYRMFSAMPGRHIGLAPLLDSPFNRARSYTKFFDITRCGGVGIYSPGSASAEVVSHNVDGLVVELNHNAWTEAILRLAKDDSLRESLLVGARRTFERLALKARHRRERDSHWGGSPAASVRPPVEPIGETRRAEEARRRT